MSTHPTNAERDNLRRLIDLACEEDLGTGDLTGRLIPAGMQARAKFVARQPLVFCGGVFLDRIARAYDEMIEMILWADEGQSVEGDTVLAEWFGPAWAIMAAERVALNFLQRLSGVATTTRSFVQCVEGTPAEIYDTRKTTPGWRELEKYAVRVGGGKNHRRGLYDAVLVKDNHLAALHRCDDINGIEDLRDHLDELRKDLGEGGFIEIEVDTLDQLDCALKLPVDVVLLDNMTPDQLRQSVARRNASAPAIALEASGGITLETLPEVARTGVERIAVGAITHSAAAVDIGLDLSVER